MYLQPGISRELAWAFRECISLSIEQTDAANKAGTPHKDQPKLVQVQADIIALQRKLFHGVESLSEREVRLTKFVYGYLRAYHPRYRIPEDHPQCGAKWINRHRLFRAVLAD